MDRQYPVTIQKLVRRLAYTSKEARFAPCICKRQTKTLSSHCVELCAILVVEVTGIQSTDRARLSCMQRAILFLHDQRCMRANERLTRVRGLTRCHNAIDMSSTNLRQTGLPSWNILPPGSLLNERGQYKTKVKCCMVRNGFEIVVNG